MKKKPIKLTYDIRLTDHAQHCLAVCQSHVEVPPSTVIENALDLYTDMIKQRQRVCNDCEMFCGREQYRVNDDVWAEAGEVQGDLCVGCLEARLKRVLRVTDFDDTHPLNFMEHMMDATRRLKMRMAGITPSMKLLNRLRDLGAVVVDFTTRVG